MKKKTANIITSLAFLLLIFGLGTANLLAPTEEYSYTERRRLKVLPTVNIENIVNGRIFAELDEYVNDHFIERDSFRGIKAWVQYRIFRRAENNGICERDGRLFKLEYPLNEASVAAASRKFNEIAAANFTGANLFYAVIPDKNYYIALDYPHIDYNKLQLILAEDTENMAYIDLFDALSGDSYYDTDSHWRQQSLQNAVTALGDSMGFTADISAMKINSSGSFLGVYAGQYALKTEPDELIYLTDAHTEAAAVYNAETGAAGPVYTTEKFTGTDPYDVFLSGAAPLLIIENTGAGTGRELVMFRDSYGSSLAPLFLSVYDRVILADIRYMSSSLISEYIQMNDMTKTDVLFIYSIGVLNDSAMLK